MISLKLLFEHLVEQGRRAVLQATRTGPKNSGRFKQIKLSEESSNSTGGSVGVKHRYSKSLRTPATAEFGGIYRFLQPITSHFLEALVSKVPAPLWTEVRRRSAKRIFGETAPFFALVGVTLVSGPERGLLTAHDELEALCGDIREAISRSGWLHNPEYWKYCKKEPEENKKVNENYVFSLADFEFGNVIDKGCNAVVYAVKWKRVEDDQSNNSASSFIDSHKRTELNKSFKRTEMESNDISQNKIYDDTFEENKENRSSIDEFPLALKMMFNYEAESNARSILTAMYKELIPAGTLQLDGELLLWKQRFMNSQVTLPPHTNIVEMPCVFVDRVPLLRDGKQLYPEALPRRLNSSGFGRNMSLFCVMKRYDCTLSNYLTNHELSSRTSLLLLTQLLEAVNHINKYGIVHRDLKSDNILISMSEGTDSPLLVLSDFGCCLTDPSLSVPFSSYESDPRQGNTALMAPEVKTAVPGLLSYINYSRADIWSAGAIALEIFGLQNPFVPGADVLLDSCTYKESQLPKLRKKISPALRCLFCDMLKRNPKQRPSPQIAATVCQLSLWAPSKWLNRHALTLPSHSEVTRWLLCLSTKVICEAGTSTSVYGEQVYEGAFNSVGGVRPKLSRPVSTCGPDGRGGHLEYEIVSTFLSRVRYDDIIQAIKWVRAF